ncbi:MAG: imidazole glycerol phosphate synthase subunit HisH [Sphingobacteriales bacterium 17-39-43]|uniref:imidazole glycerol phosphate synthase subunit HisH n=1 Tax=Daejeonella sp. TaxID=2805397 RepID=UPI000BC770A6|nr:imidazole glycerol phosphate synthase subunit HisH [Daejeonella sp.]OYZ30186.1 MAG: imidazole glycerol phosphate synthase subunit HisH [Sphingobacteriales bacterium 16-39-50]OZA22929.1 MAG: imidazole glycerol phosphate synthase subunit HisH [Sphingobacteriales bacterium 17-39-43]HQT24177.1 imidazole glycerol phosphate synthase subunit HisH [Daejeonella sp.]HQT58787.1 imidazole glycerol phosphate synthase subunit HisH [Daejeonella sp.]
MITIINYGMGNLGSVQNMFNRIGVKSRISGDLNEIKDSEKLLLPGVGAFDAAMQRINDGGFNELLTHMVEIDKVPVLGICLGMQLLTSSSEEGLLPGLGWINAKTVKFKFNEDSSLKVPHMGWNLINAKNDSRLTKNLPDEPRFYFVHSYFVKCHHPENIVCTTHYGHDFDSVIQKDNIWGAQFHPEKSHKFGMKLLKNFSEI